MQSVKKETLTQQVGEGIKELIGQLGLQPGDKLLNERELIQQFNVSRTVIREALKSLEMLGIVRLKQGDGIYVARPSMKSVSGHLHFQWQRSARTMKELLDVRIILETAAVERIILDGKHETDAIASIAAWNDRMEEKLKQGDVAAEEDFQFHRALIQATGNQMLFELSDILYSFFENVRQPQSPEEMALRLEAVEEHRDILHTIETGNIAAAQKSLRKHLQPLATKMALLESEDG